MRTIRPLTVGGALVLCALVSVRTASPTPQFPRQTNLPCRSCHVHASLLNDFGQRYFASGFRIGKRKPRTDTPPL